MQPVIDVQPHQILPPADSPVAEVVNPNGSAQICLVCEHASARIPATLGSLGLSDSDRKSHAVWDPGAGDLARQLSARLDAKLVLNSVSRLVYDCNRPPEREDAMPVRTETIEVPGNRRLTPEDRARRTAEVYDAFHDFLSNTLETFSAAPAVVTIHSFSPTWFGVPRKTEIGLLHDADDRMARAMLAAAGPGHLVELNKPYSAADGVTHLLAKQATARGLPSVMVEVRNDLLDDDAAMQGMAEYLSPMIRSALSKALTE